MSAVTDYLANLGTWNWLIAASILLALEFVVPGVHFVWFGLAAALTAAALFLASTAGITAEGMPLWMQLAIFGAFSVVCLFAVRSFGRSTSKTESDVPKLNIRGAQYIGREVIVEDAIIAGRGRIRVDDTIWSAQGEDAPVGRKVMVTGVNGSVLVVENPSDD